MQTAAVTASGSRTRMRVRTSKKSVESGTRLPTASHSTDISTISHARLTGSDQPASAA